MLNSGCEVPNSRHCLGALGRFHPSKALSRTLRWVLSVWCTYDTSAAFGLCHEGAWLFPQPGSTRMMPDRKSKVCCSTCRTAVPGRFPVLQCQSVLRPPGHSPGFRVVFSPSPKEPEAYRIPGEFRDVMSGICIGLLLLYENMPVHHSL